MIDSATGTHDYPYMAKAETAEEESTVDFKNHKNKRYMRKLFKNWRAGDARPTFFDRLNIKQNAEPTTTQTQ
jgi:hypothetical protein